MYACVLCVCVRVSVCACVYACVLCVCVRVSVSMYVGAQSDTATLKLLLPTTMCSEKR